MRLFLLLAAVLVAALAGNSVSSTPSYKFHLPQGLPDGSVLTIIFWHHKKEGFWGGSDPVKIDFYDELMFQKNKVYDIPARLIVERDRARSNDRINGVWGSKETTLDLPMGVSSMHYARYWRVDVVKIGEHQMMVYFQGFPGGLHIFKKSLNNIKSVFVDSIYIDKNKVEFHLKLPNSNVIPFTMDYVKDRLHFFSTKDLRPTLRISFPSFPIGTHINMIVVLPTTVREGQSTKKRLPENTHKPALLFAPKNGTAHFMKIIQIWGFEHGRTNYWNELYLTSSEVWKGLSDRRIPEGTRCTSWRNFPNGDLVHLNLERISLDVVKMQVLYTYERWGNPAASCEYTIPSDLVKYLDQPFDIKYVDASSLDRYLHLEHTIPSTFENKNSVFDL